MDSFTCPFAVTNFVQRNPILAIAVAIGLPAYLIRHVTSPWRRVPPGPTGWPLIGNLFTLFQLNAQKWLKFTEWRATYGTFCFLHGGMTLMIWIGDIMFLNIVGQPVIILNSHKVAVDLLDRRASNYSDRPNYIVNELLTGGLEVGFMQYGDLYVNHSCSYCRQWSDCRGPRWRLFRKSAHEGIHKSLVNNIRPIQVSEALLLTCGILINPGLWNEHNHLAAVSTLARVVYGLSPITSEQDAALSLSRSYVTRIVRAGRPSAHLVEYFTWMKHLPSWYDIFNLHQPSKSLIQFVGSQRGNETLRDGTHIILRRAEFENLFNGVCERMVSCH